MDIEKESELKININVADKVKLSLLQNNDKESIEKFVLHLKVNGWCLIDLEQIDFISSLIEKVSEFFNLKISQKAFFMNHNGLGYEVTKIKEVLRWLSNDRIERMTFPEEFKKEVMLINEFFDSFFKSLIIKNSETLFGIKFDSSKFNDITLFHEGLEYGMIDLVNYFPNLNKDNLYRNELVEQHVDPGLLAFSIYSNTSGLEMFSYMTNEWIKVPLNYGVIWTGSKAVELSSNKLRGGLHRVNFNIESKERLTLWYEVNTVEQILGIDEYYHILKQMKSTENNKNNKIFEIPKVNGKYVFFDNKYIMHDSIINNLKNNNDKSNKSSLNSNTTRDSNSFPNSSNSMFGEFLGKCKNF